MRKIRKTSFLEDRYICWLKGTLRILRRSRKKLHLGMHFDKKSHLKCVHKWLADWIPVCEKRFVIVTSVESTPYFL